MSTRRKYHLDFHCSVLDFLLPARFAQRTLCTKVGLSSASMRGLPNNPVVELLVMDSAGLEKMLGSFSVLGGGGEKVEEKIDDVVEDGFEEDAGEKKGEEGGDVAVKDSAAGDLIV